MALRRLILSDTPSPWREPVFERVFNSLNGQVKLVYLNEKERRRRWDFNFGRHPKIIMSSLTFRIHDHERYFNPGIVPFLLKFRPEVAVVTDSMKDPTTWLVFLICRALGTKVALLNDTWLGRDRNINKFQRVARIITYNYFGDAFIGASKQTLKLFKYYNRRIIDAQLFLSHLVADNDYFKKTLLGKDYERRYDVMFSGRIAPEKNPIFFANVCAKVKSRLGSCRVLIIGDGREDLRKAMQAIFEKNCVEYEFAGFIRHASLPEYYARAKLLLLPTSGDCWGVVINEAMLAGTPVVTTEMTAAAGELVIHGENGYVLSLDEAVWANNIVELLLNRRQWETLSINAQQKVREFTFDRAAAGILSAFAYLESKRGGNKTH